MMHAPWRSGRRPRLTARGPVIALALLLDALLRDPPNRFHPVAWMGSAIAAARRLAPHPADRHRTHLLHLLHLLHGAGIVLLGAALAGAVGGALARVSRRLRTTRLPILGWLLEAALLKSMFSLRGLTAAASSVQTALEAGDLSAARRLLSWHLVSRDTSRLSTAEVAAAAIESVAENASDGVIAPLLAYALGGLPAALIYRFVNTADAMLGYRDAEREWLGKIPARLDDLLNLLPARLTALLIVAAAALGDADAVNGWRVWRRDHAQTASPNAGHPMSAMAGALAVKLAKREQYTLGAGQPPPTAAHIGRANRLARRATYLAALLLTLFLALQRPRQ